METSPLNGILEGLNSEDSSEHSQPTYQSTSGNVVVENINQPQQSTPLIIPDHGNIGSNVEVETFQPLHTPQEDATAAMDPGPSTSEAPSADYRGMTSEDTYARSSNAISLPEEFGVNRMLGLIDHSVLARGKDELKVQFQQLGPGNHIQSGSDRTRIKMGTYINLQLDLSGLNTETTVVVIGVMHHSPDYKKAIYNEDRETKQVSPVFEIDGSLHCEDVELYTTNPKIDPILGRRIVYEIGKPLNLKFNVLSHSEINYGSKTDARKWLLVVRAGGMESAVPFQVVKVIRKNHTARSMEARAEEAEENSVELLEPKIRITRGLSASKKRKISQLAQLTASGAEMLPEQVLDEKIWEAETLLCRRRQI